MNKSKSIFFLLIVLLLVMVFLWTYTVLVANRGQFKKVEREMVEAEKNLQKLQSERSNYTTIKQDRELQIASFDTLQLNIPLKENSYGNNTYIQTLDIIQKIAAQNDVIIDMFKPILVNTFPEIKVDRSSFDKRVERYIVDLECHGSFNAIGKFFEDLQNNDRIVNILTFNLETEYGYIGGLFCEALLYTYVFAENK